MFLGFAECGWGKLASENTDCCLQPLVLLSVSGKMPRHKKRKVPPFDVNYGMPGRMPGLAPGWGPMMPYPGQLACMLQCCWAFI